MTALRTIRLSRTQLEHLLQAAEHSLPTGVSDQYWNYWAGTVKSALNVLRPWVRHPLQEAFLVLVDDAGDTEDAPSN